MTEQAIPENVEILSLPAKILATRRKSAADLLENRLMLKYMHFSSPMLDNHHNLIRTKGPHVLKKRISEMSLNEKISCLDKGFLSLHFFNKVY